jgi:hypothetical protein
VQSVKKEFYTFILTASETCDLIFSLTTRTIMTNTATATIEDEDDALAELQAMWEARMEYLDDKLQEEIW